ncbi:sialidase family protein [Phytohabitans sp. ZYX-F-186]|uniref:Sialidase family protein n=1 Tax=Phytohabitans maris TaxID=3071409 RepID=A0ABU0ZT89_9ACTN|nr:sialidase family protein [Phytohabitans sp. ZYX-F-186]MDQ7910011.1 sialidase family protein [Phytohabitans sp. ZYX-F-186]
MPELETRLAREREDLLDAIEQPPLERIGARAATVRRRRGARRAGAAVALLAVAGLAALRPWSGDPPPPPPVADPAPGVVYTDAGITINGLTGDGYIDPRGWITDVEFADPDHGYALVQCRAGEEPCPPSLARSTDGGITWTLATMPPAPGAGLDLTAFPDGRLLLGGYVSTDGGRTWQATARPGGPATAVGDGQLLRLGGGAVEVWSSMYGRRGELVTQPAGVTVTWVAGAPTAAGAWWVGGTRNGAPAVAVTRDAGRSWEVHPLAAAGSTAQVSVLGEHVYATVLGAGRAISAIFLSTDSGRRFTPTTPGPVATPAGLAGEAVPLLDGRLLVTGTDQKWYVSEDDGRTFAQADGSLPAVGPIVRTPAGYVAYDLFGSDWAAFSADGSTWRKLQVN